MANREWTQDEIDDQMIDDDECDVPGFCEDDCGRWINGKLGPHCRLAGTEDCDWECPFS